MYQGKPVYFGHRKCVGYTQLTGLSSAAGLADGSGGAIPATAALAICIPESQDVRYRADGTNPTSTTGMPLEVGQPLHYTGDMTKLKFFEQVASAKVNVEFYE